MSSKKNLTVTNAWICRIGKENILPVFGDIMISGGRISEIREKDFNDFLSAPDQHSEDSLNAAGRTVTVPLVNFHDHFYSRLAKGLPLSGSMEKFTEILQNLWWKIDLALDPEMVRASAQMAAMESIRNGVTYIFDHHSSPNSAKGSLEIIGNVLNEFKLRGVLCFEVTDRNGKSLSEEGLSENISFLKNSTGDDLKSMLGLHASFTLDADTLLKASELIKEFNLGIHIHLCEDESDRKGSIKKYKAAPVKRLLQAGLLNDKSIAAHGIYLDPDEHLQISKCGTSIVFNPDSNLNNGVGLPIISYATLYIPILTGTDGMNSDPARALKQLFLLARNQCMSFTESFKLIKKVYFNQLSFVRKYFSDFPSLALNDRADLIIWDYVPPTPFKEDNFWGHFIYGMLDSPIHSVIQNGNILMNNFKLHLDETEYRKSIVIQGSRLYNKISEINRDEI